MPAILVRSPKSSLRKPRASGKRAGAALSGRSGKAAHKEKVFRHPAAFGAAARKYAGIVGSGVGDLSTREGFDD